jgi:hypothetical protein
MTDPINLTQLRGLASSYHRPDPTAAVPKEALLALIDATEAARDYLGTRGREGELQAFDRLSAALARFITQ